MPIDYTSTTGSLQVRLGKIISLGKDLRAQQGSTLTNIQEVGAQYTATTIDKAEYVGTLLTQDAEQQVNQAASTLQHSVREGLEKTVLMSVNDGIREVPSVGDALRVLAVDMIESTQSIGTTGISISAVTNSATGSGTLIMSESGRFVYGGAKYATKQTVNDTILAETVNARCVKDARDGTLVRGNERWMLEGKAGVDRLDRRWQDGTSGYGSGARLMINSTCGSIEGSSVRGQNMLSNSGFERDDTQSPLDWLIATGTAGTTVRLTATAARGGQALRLVGDNTILHNVYQVMGQGPRPNIKTNTVYIVSAYLRGIGGTVNTGTIRFGLRDSADAEISGASVNYNMVTNPVSDSAWTRVTGSFTTPLSLGSAIRFAINFTVKLGNQVLAVDEVVLTEAERLYPGGPAVAVVAGTADWELDDRMAAAITKTTSEWQVELDRYLNLAGAGIQFPVSTSPTFASTHIA